MQIIPNNCELSRQLDQENNLAASQYPTLEDDIEAILHLDKLRQRAKQMRDAGVKSLRDSGVLKSWKDTADKALLAKEDKSFQERSKDDPELKRFRSTWAHEKFGEFADFITPSMMTLISTRFFPRASAGEDPKEKSAFWQIAAERLDHYNDTSAAGTPVDGVPIDAVPRYEVFEAARVAQALVRLPSKALSSASVAAYRVVFDELQGARKDTDQTLVGAARAGQGGKPSAFVTGECQRAISSLQRSLDKSAKFFETFMEFVDILRATARDSEVQTTGLVLALLDEWSIMDLRRIALHYYTAFHELRPYCLFEIKHETLDKLAEIASDKSHIGDNKSKSSTPLKDVFDKLSEFIGELQEDVARSLDNFKALTGKNARLKLVALPKTLREQLQHNVYVEGCSSVYSLFKRVEDKLGALDLNKCFELAPYDPHSFKKHVNPAALVKNKNLNTRVRYLLSRVKDGAKWVEDPTWESELKENLRSFCELLSGLAALVKRQLTPVRQYLETVLDHEVGKSSGQVAVAGELAGAAAAFAYLGRQAISDDPRLERAAAILEQAIGTDGSFETATYLATARNGGLSIALQGSEVLRAFAQLLDRVSFDVRPSTVEKMLRYFELNAVHDEVDSDVLIGWVTDQSGSSQKPHRWATAHCILALDRIVRMLDKRINRRVLRHFSFKDPDALQRTKTPTLDKLIYPDYGLAYFYNNVYSDVSDRTSAGDEEGDSIALFLERARAHIVRVPKIVGYEQPCYSLLLYGPPGTGKTTLLESLAYTSRRPLLEITPSDIIEEGESHIERRARIVFKALSVLTKCIILFDEFDPVLRSRELEKDKSQSVFSFVTPGMLPKLKDLNRHAKQQQVVYALSTNRVGTLDEAAIRSGRFDHRVGIFPPDAISRVGPLVKSVLKAYRKKSPGASAKDQLIAQRVMQLLDDTRGIGMTLFSADGNVRPAADQELGKKLDKTSILSCALYGNVHQRPLFAAGTPDADPNTPRSGRGQTFVNESRRWAWILCGEDQIHKSIESIFSHATHHNDNYEKCAWVELSKALRDTYGQITEDDVDRAISAKDNWGDDSLSKQSSGQ